MGVGLAGGREALDGGGWRRGWRGGRELDVGWRAGWWGGGGWRVGWWWDGGGGLDGGDGAWMEEAGWGVLDGEEWMGWRDGGTKPNCNKNRTETEAKPVPETETNQNEPWLY